MTWHVILVLNAQTQNAWLKIFNIKKLFQALRVGQVFYIGNKLQGRAVNANSCDLAFDGILWLEEISTWRTDSFEHYKFVPGSDIHFSGGRQSP